MRGVDQRAASAAHRMGRGTDRHVPSYYSMVRARIQTERALPGTRRHGGKRWSVGVWRHGSTLSLLPRGEEPQPEVKDPLKAPWARRSALGHREGRQEPCLALGCRELDRHRRRCRLWDWCAPQARTAWEAETCALEQRLTSAAPRGEGPWHNAQT